MFWVHLLLFLSFSVFKNSIVAATKQVPFSSISYIPPFDKQYGNQDAFCLAKELSNNRRFPNNAIPSNNYVSNFNQNVNYQTKTHTNQDGNRHFQVFPRGQTFKSDIFNGDNCAKSVLSETIDTKSSPDLSIQGSLIPFTENVELGLCETMPFIPNFQILNSNINLMPINNPSNSYLTNNNFKSKVDKMCSIDPVNEFPSIDSQNCKTPDLSIKGDLTPFSSDSEVASPLLHMSNIRPDFQVLTSDINILPNKASESYCNNPTMNCISQESFIPLSKRMPLKNEISTSYPVSSGTEFQVPISVTCTNFSPKKPVINTESTENFSFNEGCNDLRLFKPYLEIDNYSQNENTFNDKSFDLSIKGSLIPVSSNSEIQNNCFSSPLSDIKPDFQILNSDIDVLPSKKFPSINRFNNSPSKIISNGHCSSSSPKLNNRVSTSFKCTGTNLKVPSSSIYTNFIPSTNMPTFNCETSSISAPSNCNKPCYNSNKISSPTNIINTQIPTINQCVKKDDNNKLNQNKSSSQRKPFIFDCTHFLNNLPDEDIIIEKRKSSSKPSLLSTYTPTQKTHIAPKDQLCIADDKNLFGNQQISENILNIYPCIETKQEKPVFRRPLEVSIINSEPVNSIQPFTKKLDVNQCNLVTETNPKKISKFEPLYFTPTMCLEPKFTPNTDSCLSQITVKDVKLDNLEHIKVAPPIVPLNAFPNLNVYFMNDIQKASPVKVPMRINLSQSNDVQQNFEQFENQYQYTTQELPDVCVDQLTDYIPLSSLNNVEPLTSYNSKYVLPVVNILPTVSYLPQNFMKTTIVSNDYVNNDFVPKIKSVVSQILSQRSEQLNTNNLISRTKSDYICTDNTFSRDKAEPLIVPISSSYIEINPIQYLPQCNVPVASFDSPSLPTSIAPSTPKFSSYKSLQKILQIIALSELVNSRSSTNWAELGKLIFVACN